eukprot:799971-Rhodomonas_salina.1
MRGTQCPQSRWRKSPADMPNRNLILSQLSPSLWCRPGTSGCWSHTHSLHSRHLRIPHRRCIRGVCPGTCPWGTTARARTAWRCWPAQWPRRSSGSPRWRDRGAPTRIALRRTQPR